jgi:hypothetical protein
LAKLCKRINIMSWRLDAISSGDDFFSGDNFFAGDEETRT